MRQDAPTSATTTLKALPYSSNQFNLKEVNSGGGGLDNLSDYVEGKRI
jgi:hypothetical protein